MSPRASFFIPWYGLAIVWNLVVRKRARMGTCPEKQTVSEFLAALIANKWTRWPVTAAILVIVVHLFALAYAEAKS